MHSSIDDLMRLIHDMAHHFEVVINFNLVRKKFEDDLQEMKQNAAQTRSEFLTVRERVIQLQSSLALEHSLMDM
ncbi:hypothetical protein COCNU_scaffold006661G000030 [Cocos nucifera]|nr:hypothetical protein [Cocos nucifera]